MSALAGLWRTQLPNCNHFKTQISLKQRHDPGLRHSCWLIRTLNKPARQQQHHRGPLLISKPRMPHLPFLKYLLNSIQIIFPGQKGHPQWKLWRHRGGPWSGGPVGAAAGLRGRSTVLSCGHWGPKGPIGVLVLSPIASGLWCKVTIMAEGLDCAPKQETCFFSASLQGGQGTLR